MEIGITTEDIAFAESILLPEGCTFDLEERVPFIQNFGTIDLQAVPGSGKTTALLAKLLIIERKLPFDDGSGVLVISHTNAAVDEIGNKIKKYCPKLFSYPNFVGTIQSFVDKFMAIPYCINFLNFRPVNIDTTLYETSLYNEFKGIYWNEKFEKPGTWLYNKYQTQGKAIASQSGGTIAERDAINNLIHSTIKSLRFDFENNFVIDSRNNTRILKDEKSPKYKGFLRCIFRSFKKGIIPYDSAYKMGMEYIANCKIIKVGLKKRFAFVFVDEMQDMDIDQLEILDKIFFTPSKLDKCYQRIGDKNQAIYGDQDFNENTTWDSSKREQLTISGSHRLNAFTSKIVEKFGLIQTTINSNSNDYNESPKLILFSPGSEKQVLPFFSNIVNYLVNTQADLSWDKYPIKAIGWRKESDKGLSLTSYLDCYQSTENFRKKHGSSLWADINDAYNESIDNYSLKSINNTIWKGLLLTLKFENFKYFHLVNTVEKLKKHLSENNISFYEEVKEIILNLCLLVIKNDIDQAHKNLKLFISNLFLPKFNLTYSNSKEYCENKDSVSSNTSFEKNNFYKDESTGIEFEVCTVHSQKGKTHSATLYLETYYYNDSGKSYESQRLKEQLMGVQITKGGSRVKQSAKMIYVGFSRPKYLLCFAAIKEHFSNTDLETIAGMGWDIKTDLIN